MGDGKKSHLKDIAKNIQKLTIVKNTITSIPRKTVMAILISLFVACPTIHMIINEIKQNAIKNGVYSASLIHVATGQLSGLSTPGKKRVKSNTII